MKYCATTVAMPELTLAEQADLLAELGYDGIELRVRRVTDTQRSQGPSNWGYHINDIAPETFADQAPEIRKTLASAGIALAGIASNAPCTDLDQCKLLLEGCVAAGAPFFRVGAASGYKADGSMRYREVLGETVAGYERVLEITRGTGVRIVLEIHGGTIHPSASFAHRIVSNFSPTEVGVIYDPQNMVKDGYETTALALDLLGPYVAHCHLGAHRPVAGEPDDRGTVAWTWERCGLGEGLYHVPTMLAQLTHIGYDGFISIEDFSPVPPREKYADAINYLRGFEEEIQGRVCGRLPHDRDDLECDAQLSPPFADSCRGSE